MSRTVTAFSNLHNLPQPPLTSSVSHRPTGQHEHEHPRHDAPSDHRPHVRGPRREQPPGEDRPQHRSRVIHAPLQSEGAPPQLRRRHVGDERVARRRAEPLPQPVHHPQPDHLPRRARDGDDGPHHHRNEIAEHDHRPAQARPVGQSPRPELHECRRELGRPVERAQDLRPAAQHPRDERGEQRVDHFAREIVEQRDPAEQLHLPRQRR